MNNKYIFSALAAGTLLLGSCSDFDDINTDPQAASGAQVQVEYVINSAISQSQGYADFSGVGFNLIWKYNARQNFVALDRLSWSGDNYTVGNYVDRFDTPLFDYLSNFMKTSNLAVSLAQEKIAAGDATAYLPNLLQVARIWRALQMADFTDSFGPMPINGFQGVAPTYVGQQEVYHYLLTELKDASAKLNPSIVIKPGNEKYDLGYGFDFAKWQKFANTLRMRLAMRLSEVEPAYAKAEFEDAVKAAGGYVSTAADQFKVKEYGEWTDLSGVYSLTWLTPLYSTTMNNIAVGLGGVPTATSHPEFASYVKPADYAGVKYDKQFAMHTNDPMKGFWFDGMPAVMDPRIYAIYDAPGSETYSYFGNNSSNLPTEFKLFDAADKTHTTPVATETHVKFVWNGGPEGSLGNLTSLNEAYNTASSSFYPTIARKYRGKAYGSSNERMWIGEWESYFLIAEAAERGWTVPMSGKEAYEAGIKANFEYFGLGAFSADYIASTSYNRVGTSVAWDHTTEAPEQTLNYVDGYTGATGTMTWKRPVNGLYTAANNDHLNKIITQKYIANDLYHPLEAWSDHRRLGLPFWENPVCEVPVQSMPELTVENSTGPAKVGFFMQRVHYPLGLQTSNPEGYGQAVGHLGAGGDNTLTPLWWAKK